MSVKSTFKANEKMTTTMSAIGKGSVLEKMGYMSSDECFDSAVGMFGQGDLEYDSQSELRPNKIEYNGKMKVIGGFRVGVVATTIGEDAYRKMEYHQRTLRGETDYSINITVKIN
ncbi:MAG: hypothetical protein KAU20_05875 [Nanoarchaeota archaeon]|nr:hypothetical protein [Nanoarchaeota archaeon]